jgi:hypothetical protein
VVRKLPAELRASCQIVSQVIEMLRGQHLLDHAQA